MNLTEAGTIETTIGLFSSWPPVQSPRSSRAPVPWPVGGREALLTTGAGRWVYIPRQIHYRMRGLWNMRRHSLRGC